MDSQRTYFNDTLDRMQRQFAASIKDTNKKIEDVISSLEYTQARLDESTEKVTNLLKEKIESDNIIKHLTEENQILRDQQFSNKTRMDYMDDQGRRNNLRFSGITENNGENWEQSQMKITNIIREKLNIKDIGFERVHRVGRPTTRGPRDIVAKFKTYPDRESVFLNSVFL